MSASVNVSSVTRARCVAGGGVCSKKRRINALDAEMVINLAEVIIIFAELIIILAESVMIFAELIIIFAELIINFAEIIINFAEIPSTIPSMVISACKCAFGVYVSDAELWQCKSPNGNVKNKFNTTL